ncbi:MAG: hypothetical protein GY952_06705 [Rhodobacteraceae bacterium]|nr:hypothetical protein [Paracoccaceae bacterium]
MDLGLGLGLHRTGLTAEQQIAALFNGVDETIWLDPSDLTSLFQLTTGGDNSGDTDVVGVALDKAQMNGKTASAFIAAQPELSPAPGPYVDTSGWTAQDANLSVSSGALVIEAQDGSWDRGYITVSGLTIGATYHVTPNLRQTIGTGCRLIIGFAGSLARNVSPSEFTDEVFVVVADATSGQLSVYAATSGSAGDTVEVASVSIKEVPGNRLVAPSDAARPILNLTGGIWHLTNNGTNSALIAAFPSSVNMRLYKALKTSDASFIGVSDNVDQNALVCVDGSGSDPHTGVGTPTYAVDGVAVSPATEDTLHDAISVGAWKVPQVNDLTVGGSFDNFVLGSMAAADYCAGDFGPSIWLPESIGAANDQLFLDYFTQKVGAP